MWRENMKQHLLFHKLAFQWISCSRCGISSCRWIISLCVLHQYLPESGRGKLHSFLRSSYPESLLHSSSALSVSWISTLFILYLLRLHRPLRPLHLHFIHPVPSPSPSPSPSPLYPSPSLRLLLHISPFPVSALSRPLTRLLNCNMESSFMEMNADEFSQWLKANNFSDKVIQKFRGETDMQ